jgi:patatin-related protein
MSKSLSPPKIDCDQEVRFAVVMYGGVSLAIYINGIAQELLRMVRATAAAGENGAALKYDELSGSERVYRKLSYLLAGETDLQQKLESNADIPTGFVIDIISGTSAGGINGIFLAKALANNQTIDRLQQLWVQEGAIAKLINDKLSIDRPLAVQDPPTSLLNSQRMYFQLLKAFDGMSNSQPATDRDSGRSLVKELDLFVTATDLRGITLPIRLADDVVYERRHRNVFRFIYEQSGGTVSRNDFTKDHNPFLAYAARCTSAFPFAFEPMALFDVDGVLDRYSVYGSNSPLRSNSDLWKPFFRSYEGAKTLKTIPYPIRPFGDGGYLDNKPFSYAIETLTRRQADVPVKRKLIYIEPSPQRPEDTVELQGKPNAIENVMYALLTLPRYETIREDLQRVVERNRLINRVNDIVEGVERDELKARPKMEETQARPKSNALWAQKELTDVEWATLDLTDMIQRKGRGYLAYHRLAISAVTDELAALVARVGGLDETSDYFIVIRNLIRAWRVKTYIEYRDPSTPPEAPTVNAFLNSFALSYRLRRLMFVSTKADQLFSLNKDARDIIRQHAEWFADSAGDLQKEDFRDELKEIKRVLKARSDSLRKLARSLRSRYAATPAAQGGVTPQGAPPSPVSKQTLELFKTIRESVNNISSLNVPEGTDPVLHYFLSKEAVSASDPSSDCETVEDKAEDRAQAFLESRPEIMKQLQELADQIERQMKGVMEESEEACLTLLKEKLENPSRAVAREVLRHYYQNFDDCDMVIFPVLYSTDLGEASPVEIFRFSPMDANALVDERQGECRKLAGTTLGNFGAFLQERWRQNDILWGRLDGAERIITALLPPTHPLRRQLIGEAHAAIVSETIGHLGQEQLNEMVSEMLMRVETREEGLKLLDDFIKTLKQNSPQGSFDGLIDEKNLRDYYWKTYEKRRGPDTEMTLAAAARATTVVGKILALLSRERNVNDRYVLWVARLGSIFWSLVEVSVPRSMRNLFFRHWLKLLYVFEIFVIVGGTLLTKPGVSQFGWTAFGITAAVNIIAWWLGDLMRGKRRIWNFILALLCSTVAILALVGGLKLADILFGWRIGELTPLGWISYNLRGLEAWFASHLPSALWTFVRRFLFLIVALSGVFILWRMAPHEPEPVYNKDDVPAPPATVGPSST